MKMVNMHTAKTTLSQLVEAALLGEEIVIAKHGKPVARLVPFEWKDKLRPIGLGAKFAPFQTDSEFELLSATNPDKYEQSPTDPLFSDE